MLRHLRGTELAAVLATSTPCPCGASNDPSTVPSFAIWIIDGGREQQSEVPVSASSSRFVRSFGRSYTQTVSSFGATARPVTPPIFHLLGSCFGQPGS
ncbi:MAG: hypothetical protein DMF88_11500 [Acidobacteria bacterium]|nr:MAG: hypothetical protein DMF88_11500 [Acidobacteriota bacterium]